MHSLFSAPSTEFDVDGWYHFPKAVSAPAFRLLDIQKCKLTNLGNIKSEKVLLTFIPGVWAPWARKLLMQLNQHVFEAATFGAEVVAIVAQREDQLQQYCEDNNLSIRVLADPYGAITTRYGIFDEIVTEPMQLSRPALFVLDRDKQIHFKFMGKHLADRPGWTEIEWALAQEINPAKGWWVSLPFIKQIFYAGH